LKDPELTAVSGYRAAEAFIRPTPTFVAGDVLDYGFDLRSCKFQLKLNAPKSTPQDAPTVVFLPEYHFPKELCDVQVSAGKWEISHDEDEGTALQRLKWWHPEDEQELQIIGLVRKHNVPQGSEEEAGYLEQCQEGYSNCTLM
jgi:hypothetical protein